MKVVVSAGGRFHALRLAQQLHKHKSLCKLFTFDYTAKDTHVVPPALVDCITSCKLINDLIVRLRLARFIDKGILNIFKDNLFEKRVRTKLAACYDFDLFVVWGHYARSCIDVVKRRGIPVIIESGSCHIRTQQELLRDEYARWNVPLTPIHEKTLSKMMDEYHQADYIMTLSSFARQSFISQGIDTNKVLMVPCGTDVEFFQQAAQPQPTAPLFRVIFVGMVTLRKGIHYLIEAWNKAQLPTGKTELIVVGPQQKDFSLIAPQLHITPNIKFIGPVDRTTLRALYQQSSVFVLPSIEDGFGMVIGEAMASGLPIICTTHTAGPDVITDQKEGFIIPPQKSDVLAEKIRWCYEYQKEAAQMGREGMNRIKAFTWNIYGERVLSVYRAITNHSDVSI